MYDAWYCFSPAKNNIADAAKCVAKGIPSYGAAEAEYNFYEWTNKMLAIAGVEIEKETVKTDFNGMAFAFGPKITGVKTSPLTLSMGRRIIVDLLVRYDYDGVDCVLIR